MGANPSSDAVPAVVIPPAVRSVGPGRCSNAVRMYRVHTATSRESSRGLTGVSPVALAPHVRADAPRHRHELALDRAGYASSIFVANWALYHTVSLYHTKYGCIE